MKKLFLNLLGLGILSLVATTTNGQIRIPAASPYCEITQEVGLSEVKINYSRPSMKGRTIFAADGLVPFGQYWRTGANAATKITLGDDAKFGGIPLKKGAYALLTIPFEDHWAIHLYNYESGNWASYREKDPVASFEADTQELPFVAQSLNILLGNFTLNSADMIIFWEQTFVAIHIEMDVDSKVMSDIDRVMTGPSQGDYYAAATYFHESGKDLNKALEYVQMATRAPEPKFWQVRREALILADMGRKVEAIEAAKRSMQLAEQAGNEDYIRMNQKSIKEWSM